MISFTTNTDTIENNKTKRECIANIIDILQVSSASERKEYLIKIKKELEFEMSYSSKIVMGKLKGILKNMDKELKKLTCSSIKVVKKTTPSKQELVQKYKMKRVEVRLKNVSSECITFLFEKKAKKKDIHRLKTKFTKPIQRNVVLEKKQMKKLKTLQVEPEQERAIYSRYDFFAVLGLSPSY